MIRKVGVGLVVAAYSALLYTSLAAPAYARAHMHLDASIGTRMAADPRCLVVLDPHQHGCHTFMIAVLLGLAGLMLARFGHAKVASTLSGRPL